MFSPLKESDLVHSRKVTPRTMAASNALANAGLSRKTGKDAKTEGSGES